MLNLRCTRVVSLRCNNHVLEKNETTSCGLLRYLSGIWLDECQLITSHFTLSLSLMNLSKAQSDTSAIGRGNRWRTALG